MEYVIVILTGVALYVAVASVKKIAIIKVPALILVLVNVSLDFQVIHVNTKNVRTTALIKVFAKKENAFVFLVSSEIPVKIYHVEIIAVEMVNAIMEFVIVYQALKARFVLKLIVLITALQMEYV